MKNAGSSIPRRARAYTALAAGYDVVMTHVNYDDWASYIHKLIGEHAASATAVAGNDVRVLELGCGTGSIGLALCCLGAYDYVGLDLSAEMLARARKKGDQLGLQCVWMQADYSDFEVAEAFDVVLLLYDGLNYTVETDGVRHLFACVARALRPGGLFLVDQSTPANSEVNGELFEDEGGDEAFRYVRSSHYDANTRIHRTVFRINHLGTSFEEEHVQRAYAAEEIEPLFGESGMGVLAAYDGFTRKPVSGASERIQWVARRVDAR